MRNDAPASEHNVAPRHRADVSITVLAGAHGQESTLAFRDLGMNAAELSLNLRARGVKQGDTIAIFMPTCLQAVCAMLAVWQCGAAFSVLPVQFPVSGDPQLSDRARAILDRLKPKLVLTLPQHVQIARSAELCSLAVDVTGRAETQLEAQLLSRDDNALAFVQFSSGSTSENLKGATVRHAQLNDNINGIAKKIRIVPKDKIVIWTPLFHDLGLVSLLIALRQSISVVMIPTESFMKRPVLWLETIDRFRGTISPGPPFAFHLLTRRAHAISRKLDLSSWKYAGVGAEPVFPERLRAFEQAFAEHGLIKNTLQGVYGLAESVLVVSSGSSREPRESLFVDSLALREAGRIDHVAPNAANALELAACGSPVEHMEVRIVDDRDATAAAHQVGRILVRGPSITTGYFGECEPVTKDGWLDTGDLGFMHNGSVFVVSRAKDLIKRGGMGIAPQDIETVVEELLGQKTGRTAAFSVVDHTSQKELVVVLVEDPRSHSQSSSLAVDIRNAVLQSVGVPIDELLFVGLGEIPRTSSGKLKRGAAREQFLRGTLTRR